MRIPPPPRQGLLRAAAIAGELPRRPSRSRPRRRRAPSSSARASARATPSPTTTNSSCTWPSPTSRQSRRGSWASPRSRPHQSSARPSRALACAGACRATHCPCFGSPGLESTFGHKAWVSARRCCATCSDWRSTSATAWVRRRGDGREAARGAVLRGTGVQGARGSARRPVGLGAAAPVPRHRPDRGDDLASMSKFHHARAPPLCCGGHGSRSVLIPSLQPIDRLVHARALTCAAAHAPGSALRRRQHLGRPYSSRQRITDSAADNRATASTSLLGDTASPWATATLR